MRRWALIAAIVVVGLVGYWISRSSAPGPNREPASAWNTTGTHTLHVVAVNQNITPSGRCVGPDIEHVLLQVVDPQFHVLGQAVTGDEVQVDWPSPPHNSGVTQACTVSIYVDLDIAESVAYQIVLTDAHGLRRSSPYLTVNDLDGAGWSYVFCVNGEDRCGAAPTNS